jgi:hypothetical protein
MHRVASWVVQGVLLADTSFIMPVHASREICAAGRMEDVSKDTAHHALQSV